MNIETMIEEKLLIETLRRQVATLEEHVKLLNDVIVIKDESIDFLRKTIAIDDVIIKTQKSFLTPSLN